MPLPSKPQLVHDIEYGYVDPLRCKVGWACELATVPGHWASSKPAADHASTSAPADAPRRSSQSSV